MSGSKPASSLSGEASNAVLNALPDAVVVLDGEGRLVEVNIAAEQLFGVSRTALGGRALTALIPGDSPIHTLVAQARDGGQTVSQDDVVLESPRLAARNASVHAAPVPELPGHVTLTLRERTMAHKLDRQLVHRNAARSVTAMAALLAHEVKNPLSGIRGAAQLLEQTAGEDDRRLTGLIREEADRIVTVLSEMEIFSDERPIERGPVNIHEVLDHVKQVAQAGVGANLTIREAYDPSLPPVLGNRNLLIQALLNLAKNAAEAVGDDGGTLTLETRYQHGIRLAVPGGGRRVDLPLVVTLTDDGPGIPADLQRHLFDPFVSTKTGSRGLGLALVAKVVEDHGGVIEYDTGPRGTAFRIMLPTTTDEEAR
ncbi:signal transduction histidine kinase, nitrogen specific, NtrB [Limimonas halophila]|uniref:histidine kinase n=1 Tax=Limimonas halophila TaxID=1082479 RepID=A0A1G7NCL9_9PROT|nr:ATP-binding protein [Limimonas halophila]SDF71647.1 signal transduction histidine kinase, nitrogen specific, NtrB [Limimonas halophila]